MRPKEERRCKKTDIFERYTEADPGNRAVTIDQAKSFEKAWLTLIVYASVSLLGAAVMLIGDLNSMVFATINHFAANNIPDAVLQDVTMLGEGLWEMALLAPLLLLAPRVNVALLYAAPLSLIVTHVPKLLLRLPRPGSLPAGHPAHLIDAPVAMNTFPSGHAVIAGLVAAAIILGSESVRQRVWMALVVLTLTSLIACSRIAVGAHWPLDVLAGSAFGVAVGCFGVRLAERFYRHSRPARLTVAMIYGLGAIALAFSPAHHGSEALLRDILVAIGGISAVAAIARASRGDEGSSRRSLAQDESQISRAEHAGVI
jgi:membrane-associated phospholipid phosphatase